RRSSDLTAFHPLLPLLIGHFIDQYIPSIRPFHAHLARLRFYSFHFHRPHTATAVVQVSWLCPLRVSREHHFAAKIGHKWLIIIHGLTVQHGVAVSGSAVLRGYPAFTDLYAHLCSGHIAVYP